MTQVTIKKVKYSDQKEWLELRKQGIGGSDAAAVCGLNPYKSPLQVYFEKLGELEPPQENRFIKWGKILEPVVAEYFSKQTGLKISRINQILINPKYPFMLANIDRRIVGKREGLEVKTTSAWNTGRINEGIPDEYALQCHHYMAVTGWERWHLAVLIGGNDFRHFVIERDEEIIQNLITIEKRFWEDHVLKRIPPEPDWRDTDLISQMYPHSNGETIEINNPDAESLVESLLSLQEKEKELKKQKEELQNKLKALLGDAEKAVVNGHIVSWKSIKSTGFKTKEFQKDHPDLYSQYTYTREYRRFSVK